MPDSDPPDDERRKDISRRQLIRRAAAVGGAAGAAAIWTAPRVYSLPLAQAQGSPPPPPDTAGCFKYMFNWCWAQEVQNCVDSGALSSGFNQNSPALECQQSLLENAGGQIQSNPTCCQENDPGGNNLQWHQVPDFDGTCVTRTGAPCTCPTPTGGAFSVTFTITCPDCYFGDVTVLHGSREGLASGNCGSFSLSTSNSGGNPFTTSWTINFPGGSSGRVPIWIKFWVGCGLSVCSPQIVPCTQGDCLPGGEPVASRTLNI